MAKELYFFLTKNDLISILQKVEQFIQLKYVESKAYFTTNEIKEYISLEKYEELGINKSGNHQAESILVVERTHKVNVREVQQVDGSIKYYVDQMNNEESVLFWPGGIFDNKYLICGHVGTAYLNEKSKMIFDIMQKMIKKQCKTKVGKYYVSEEAKKLYNDIRFITININQSKEYDLKI